MAVVQVYRPPTKIVKAVGPKPQPFKPSPAECAFNASDATDQMAENNGQPNADPDFPSQIYQNGNRGQRQVNPEGESEADGIALIFTWLIDEVGCMANAF